MYQRVGASRWAKKQSPLQHVTVSNEKSNSYNPYFQYISQPGFRPSIRSSKNDGMSRHFHTDKD